MTHPNDRTSDVWGPNPPRFQPNEEPRRGLPADPPLVSNVDVVYKAGDHVSSPDDRADDDPEVAEIRQEIEHTRAELSETIDQIQERLSPQHLVEEARDAVKTATIGKAERMVSNVTDTARGAGGGFMDTIRENPLPAAMAALGLGWLWRNRPHSSPSRSSYGGYRDYEDWERDRGRGYGSSYGYASGGAADYPPRYRGPSAYYGTRPTDEHGGMVERVQDKAGEVVDQARETAGDLAGRAGHMMGGAGRTTGRAGAGFMDTVRSNPVPAAIAAVSLGWLFMNRESRDDRDARYYAGYTRDYSERRGNGVGHAVSGAAGQVADTVGGAAERVGETVSGAAGQVGGTVSGAAERVGETMGSAWDRVSDLPEGAGHQAYRARTQLERWMGESPLAVGAAVLGIGAMAGLAAPTTRREAELMGPMRETFMEKAQEVVQETQEKVSHVVEEVQRTATDEAKKQHLTS